MAGALHEEPEVSTGPPEDELVALQQRAPRQDRPERPSLQPGIVVRNTFIDVYHPDEESDGDTGSCASPHRRNLSAPPSPTRARNQWADKPEGDHQQESDPEDDEDSGGIPNYQWAAHGELVRVERAQKAGLRADAFAAEAWPGQELDSERLPGWLRSPPGSPKKVPARPKKSLRRSLETQAHQRSSLSDFLETVPPPQTGMHGIAYGIEPSELTHGLGTGVGSEHRLGLGLGGVFHQGFGACPGHSPGLGFAHPPAIESCGLQQPPPSHPLLATAARAAGQHPGVGYGASVPGGFGRPDPRMTAGHDLAPGPGRACGLSQWSGLGRVQEHLGLPPGHSPYDPAPCPPPPREPLRDPAPWCEPHRDLAPWCEAHRDPAPWRPPGDPHRDQAQWLQSGRDQGLWARHRSLGSCHVEVPLAPPEMGSGSAYVSGNPPPRNPLGSPISTEAPAYILGGACSAPTPVLASQPVRPREHEDASRRQPNMLRSAYPPEPYGGHVPSVSRRSAASSSAGPFGPAYGPDGMPAFQIAQGIAFSPGAQLHGGLQPVDHLMENSAHRSRRVGSGPADPRVGASASMAWGVQGFGGAHGAARTRGSGFEERGRPGHGSRRGGGGDEQPARARGVAAAAPAAAPALAPGHAATGLHGPWLSPSAEASWLAESRQGLEEVEGPTDEDEVEGQWQADGRGGGSLGNGAAPVTRSKNSGKSARAAADGEKTGEAKPRIPLSGGGPKRTDYIKKYGVSGSGEGDAQLPPPTTTMMLKNIPCRKGQEEVMLHINEKGFLNRYDFFYLPRDVKFRANLGYAFINFVTPEDAARFEEEMNGYRFAGSGSTKACAVVPAHVQGLMNNLAAFKRTEVMRSSRKPYFSGVVTL